MEIITSSVQAQTFGGHDPCQGDMMCPDDFHCPPDQWVSTVPLLLCRYRYETNFNPVLPIPFVPIMHSIFEHN